jgi:hypothetical protein
MEIYSLVLAGLITYLIAICFKYLIKFGWAFMNWLAEKYIVEVLGAKVEGEPMVDYYPAKEVFKIRKAIKNG